MGPLLNAEAGVMDVRQVVIGWFDAMWPSPNQVKLEECAEPFGRTYVAKLRTDGIQRENDGRVRC